MNPIATLKISFSRIIQNRKAMATALFFPAILLIATDFLQYFIPAAAFKFLAIIFNYIFQSLIAINTHRIMILGADSVPKWGLIDWSKREMKFTIYVMIMSLVGLPLAVLIFIPYVGLVLFAVTYSIILARWSLSLPSTAIDTPLDLKGAWKLSAKNPFYLVTVVIIFPMLFSLVMSAPVFILPESNLSAIYVTFASVLVMVLVISNLSVAYSLISDSSKGT